MSVYTIRYVIEVTVEADGIEGALAAGREKLGPVKGDITEVKVVRSNQAFPFHPYDCKCADCR